MLEHAFVKRDLKKVEFPVDERNIKSRKAVNLLEGFKSNICCYRQHREEWLGRKS